VVDAAAVRRVWDEVLTMVGRKSKKVAAWAREATVREVDRDTLVLVFRHTFHAHALAADPDLLVESVHEALGGEWQIRCEVAGQPGAVAAPAPAAAPAAPPAPRPAARPAAAPAADEDAGDWPTTARPGGAPGPAPEPDPEPAARAAAPARPRSGGGRQSGERPAGGRQPRGRGARGGGDAPKPSNNDRPAPGVRWEGADEPPFDPDYDPPVRDVPGYEGFDPGDEPLDEVIDEQTARQTSEQQALQLLQQTLGAEKIGEVDAR
jgi:DNA polymerase-3 subunit gamma/tau